MKKENVCHLIPQQPDCDTIHIVNLVYETKPEYHEALRTIPTYRMHYVTSGKGLLYTPGVIQTIQKGDIFFSSPAAPYSIESQEELKYIYISYLGTRANSLMEKLKISHTNCVFHGFEKTASMWKKAFKLPPEMINLRCESILLYIFSEMGIQFFEKREHKRQEKNAGLLVKKYLDENYSDPDLTLEKVGDVLSYHRKYISLVFKNEFSMGFSYYLNSIRVHQACVLMEQGFTSMQDIANLCGFRDSSYFSRVFKDHMGVPPKAHMDSLVRKE